MKTSNSTQKFSLVAIAAIFTLASAPGAEAFGPGCGIGPVGKKACGAASANANGYVPRQSSGSFNRPGPGVKAPPPLRVLPPARLAAGSYVDLGRAVWLDSPRAYGLAPVQPGFGYIRDRDHIYLVDRDQARVIKLAAIIAATR